MEKDIFAPKELSQKLREIGFDEPYIAFYYYKRLILTRKKATDIAESNDIIKAPTWEQVFKWFKEKGYFSSQYYVEGTTDFFFRIFNNGKLIYESPCLFKKHHYYDYLNYLTLELIELYKKTKQ